MPKEPSLAPQPFINTYVFLQSVNLNTKNWQSVAVIAQVLRNLSTQNSNKKAEHTASGAALSVILICLLCIH